MRKYKKDDLLQMDAVEVYKIVLQQNDMKMFPSGFWKSEDAKKRAGECTRYLIEEVLKYDNRKIKQKVSQRLFVKYKLSGMLNCCFKGSAYEAINNAYPNRFNRWELGNTTTGCWKDKENGKKSVRWLIEEELDLSEEELKQMLCKKLFDDNNLTSMLNTCFNGSPYQAINEVYPNKYKVWEFKNVPINYWKNEENVKQSIRWLVDEKLKLSDDELKEKLCTKLFMENGLGAMLRRCFNGSPYEAINAAYPGKFKKTDFKGYCNRRYNKV